MEPVRNPVRIVEAFNEGEQVLARFTFGSIISAIDAFRFERGPETLHRRVSRQSTLRLMEAVALWPCPARPGTPRKRIERRDRRDR